MGKSMDAKQPRATTEIPTPALVALAVVLHYQRPDWDLPGIKQSLWNNRYQSDSRAFIAAAVKAARNPANRTPAIIRLPGRR